MFELKFIAREIFKLLYSQNSSDILGLIQVMIMTFGDRPPVYAKQRPDMASSTPYPTQREYCHYILFVLELFYFITWFVSKTEHDCGHKPNDKVGIVETGCRGKSSDILDIRLQG